MKISKVYIKNFRSIKEIEFWFPESGIMILVGENNAGKSNIVRAINNILGETWWGKNIEPMDFYMRNTDNIIEITIEFDNNRKVIFNSNENSWPKYYNEENEQIKSYQGNIKEDFPCIYLPAQRNISQALSFHKRTLMGKIAHSFNKLVREKNLTSELKSKFNEIMEIFNKIEQFKQFKDDFILFFNELQPSITYKLKVDFKPFTPLNYFKTINILINDESLGNNYDIDMEELGEGTRNLIILSLLRSYAKNFKKEAQGLLIIEEPEIYMHPQARKHLLNIFKEIVRNSNIQIMITTHSSSFIETEHFDNIALVRKLPGEGTKVIQVKKDELSQFSNETGAEGKSTPENITEFYAITSNERLKEAFFAKYVILVEGETEELCFPILLKKLGFDPDRQGISVIRVGGKAQIPKYWRLFYKFQMKLLVVFDNDTNKEAKERNNEIISKCCGVSIDDIEDIDSNKTFKILTGSHNQKLLIFRENFDNALKEDLRIYCETNSKINKYADFESEAKELGLNKPQKARYITMKILDNYPEYIPSFIYEIRNILEIE